jgi:hypothetical protein
MDPLFFDSRNEFRTWLEGHHDTIKELWVGYYKADTEKSGIGYGESVEEALCFGWIDGLVKGIDDETYTRRFTPRSSDSKWSKANQTRVARRRGRREARVDLPAGHPWRGGAAPSEAVRESDDRRSVHAICRLLTLSLAIRFRCW